MSGSDTPVVPARVRAVVICLYDTVSGRLVVVQDVADRGDRTRIVRRLGSMPFVARHDRPCRSDLGPTVEVVLRGDTEQRFLVETYGCHSAWLLDGSGGGAEYQASTRLADLLLRLAASPQQ